MPNHVEPCCKDKDEKDDKRNDKYRNKHHCKAIVVLSLDYQSAAHQSRCDTHLVWNKLDDTLPRIFLLEDELLHQFVPINKVKRSEKTTPYIHSNC